MDYFIICDDPPQTLVRLLFHIRIFMPKPVAKYRMVMTLLRVHAVLVRVAVYFIGIYADKPIDLTNKMGYDLQ